MKYGLLITAALMLSPFAAGAQTASTTASVNIENYPLNIIKLRDLNFGSVIPSAGIDGTMTVSPSGTPSTTGGVIYRLNSGYEQASYAVSGVPAASFSVTVAPTTITLSSPRGTLTVGNIALNQATPIVLDGSTGMTYFTLGATLFVNSGQLPGNYTGTFDVTVAYN